MARYAAQQQLSVDELRVQISRQLRSNAAFSSKVYQEQPIIMTGAQLKSFVPDAIREARALARHQHPSCTSTAELFYAQARMLAGYEDDFEFTGEFSHYYPTYEDMNNEQLRGYFAWRTKVRRGVIEKGSLSFAYVYLYELMHLIGVESALAGYQAMKEFGGAYRRFDKRFGRHLDDWLDDFAIYYGLEPQLSSSVSFAQNDAAFSVLVKYGSHSDEELFSTLAQLSSYPIEDSPFFMEHALELKALVARTYRLVAQHHDAKLKTSLAAKLSGRMGTERLWLFQRAVFADPLELQNAEIKLSPYDIIFCRNGAWFRMRYAALEGALPWVSQLLETCESILRDACAYPNLLGRPIKTKYILKGAEDLAAAMVATARTRKEREVHIDFESLESIRKAADITCEKLIVEEDLNQQSCHSEQSAQRGVEESPQSPLTALERALIALLLEGAPLAHFEREHACIASVLIDSINEKLYEKFADICIDTCGDAPQIIEDYIEELRKEVTA